MKGLAGTTTILSIVAAVALWSIATWLEGEREVKDAVSVEAVRAFSDEVTADTDIRSDGILQTCRDAENSIVQIVEGSRSCVIDDDCTIFDYGYPIQCLTSVVKTEIPALRREYRNYQQRCEYRVYYDCPSEPLHRKAVCRTGQCTVELQTNDVLKDATLEHIGVDPGAGLAPDPRNPGLLDH